MLRQQFAGESLMVDQSTSPSSYSDLSYKDMAGEVFKSFRESGFSDPQARALTAEINRENNLKQKYLFGSHKDPANNATNVGMLSWQGDRAPAAMEFMRERGVIGEDGRIIPGRAALQAQTDFIRQEMETNPSYAKTREQFLENPDVDANTSARVLGDNYIRWRRTDPEYAASGNQRIAEGYALLGGEGGTGSSGSGGTGSSGAGLGSLPEAGRPETEGGVEAALRLLLESDGGEEAAGRDRTKAVMTGLSALGQAFDRPKFSPVKSSAKVQRGRGGDPLSRFEGLASLRSR
jgi:hypothetical protein